MNALAALVILLVYPSQAGSDLCRIALKRVVQELESVSLVTHSVVQVAEGDKIIGSLKYTWDGSYKTLRINSVEMAPAYRTPALQKQLYRKMIDQHPDAKDILPPR